jgi:hypothetical protein
MLYPIWDVTELTDLTQSPTFNGKKSPLGRQLIGSKNNSMNAKQFLNAQTFSAHATRMVHFWGPKIFIQLTLLDEFIVTK